MQFITKANWIIILVVLAAGVLAIGTASSVSSCCGIPEPEPALQPFTYADPAPVPVEAVPTPVFVSAPVNTGVSVCNNCTAPAVVNRPAYKIVRETEMREEEVTTYETVWDNETRYRTRTVAKQVPETTTRRETVRVSKPVWETVEKETTYDVVEYVRETSEREEVSTVSKPVTEYQEREIVETRNKPVQETVMQQRTHQVNKPVTTYETRTREVGEYETQYVAEPAQEYPRLTWQKGGEYFDPKTGETRTRAPGLYWANLKADPEYKAERVYKPRQITETVPVTRMVPETVVEEVPVTVEKIIQEKVVRKEQVPVTRMVEEQVVKKIPVTTYKPVTKQVVKKTPVKVCRTETVDEVREVPVTTYKTVTETIQEPYTVKVARRVPKVVKVQRPYTVCRRVPIDACAPVTETGEITEKVSASKVESPATAETAEPKEESQEEVKEPAKAAEPADSVPSFNPPAPADTKSEVTANYPVTPEEMKVITTDPPAQELPAVPNDLLPKIAVKDATDQAPPLSEADKTPVLNGAAAPAETKTDSAGKDAPAEKPASSAADAESDKSSTNSETGNFSQGYFHLAGSDPQDSQEKRQIPEVAPTRLLK